MISKILAVIMAVMVTGSGFAYSGMAESTAVTAVAEEYTTGEYENLTYNNYGDYIEISDCKMYETREAVVPSEIEGVPVTSIGDFAFEFCYFLSSLEIPDSITSIGRGAFYNCMSLTSLKIPSGVTSIRERSFMRCSALSSITVPENVTSIGNGSFGYCVGLKEITFLNPRCEIIDEDNSGFTVSSDYYNGGFYFDGTIYGYENSTAQEYAEKYGCKFESLGKAPEKETPSGDMNGDGEADIADAVILQEYILGRYEFTGETAERADLTGDGIVDSFDLVRLKQLIVGGK